MPANNVSAESLQSRVWEAHDFFFRSFASLTVESMSCDVFETAA